jgi:glucoamylase
MSELGAWIAAQSRFAAGAMLKAISATGLVMERPGFGQRIVPRPGSVLASPVLAHYDPDPDYFFHWFRDSALVIDALRIAIAAGYVADAALSRFREFVHFSLELDSLDGREFLRRSNFRAHVQPALLRYVRPDAEIAALSGETVRADVRVNADGTPDITRWSRPQTDGPALRAMALLRWWRQFPHLEATLRAQMRELISGDLAFTLSAVERPSSDIWEEESGFHYYTQLVQAEALQRGAKWLEESGQEARAESSRVASRETLSRLDEFWSETDGFYRSRATEAGDSDKKLDIAVILGIVHAGRAGGPHSVLDPKAQATLTALRQLFESEYAINRERPQDRGVAMGRYPQDRYYSGGAWFLATLAAAEFYFRLATALAGGAQLAVTVVNQRFREHLGADAPATDSRMLPRLALQLGDAVMRTVQAFTPAGGELSEQFDQTTGAQASARHLSWSYAAFVTAAASRSQACQAIAV